ncbi:uncharacterized protein [Hyperolius riggenbachi]|uniref:uncharacterized protein n=1 Tax=Hyperolius riggenbachi TaxID=752182 RepID=UPI0035A2A447
MKAKTPQKLRGNWNNDPLKTIIKALIKKIVGVVNWFNCQRGYGFISRGGKEKDVFVHWTAIRENNSRNRFRSLRNGETVEFDVIEGTKGTEAANVTGPGGTPVQGSRYVKHLRPRRYCEIDLDYYQKKSLLYQKLGEARYPEPPALHKEFKRRCDSVSSDTQSGKVREPRDTGDKKDKQIQDKPVIYAQRETVKDLSTQKIEICEPRKETDISSKKDWEDYWNPVPKPQRHRRSRKRYGLSETPRIQSIKKEDLDYLARTSPDDQIRRVETGPELESTIVSQIEIHDEVKWPEFDSRRKEEQVLIPQETVVQIQNGENSSELSKTALTFNKKASESLDSQPQRYRRKKKGQCWMETLQAINEQLQEAYLRKQLSDASADKPSFKMDMVVL